MLMRPERSVSTAANHCWTFGSIPGIAPAIPHQRQHKTQLLMTNTNNVFLVPSAAKPKKHQANKNDLSLAITKVPPTRLLERSGLWLHLCTVNRRSMANFSKGMAITPNVLVSSPRKIGKQKFYLLYYHHMQRLKLVKASEHKQIVYEKHCHIIYTVSEKKDHFLLTHNLDKLQLLINFGPQHK